MLQRRVFVNETVRATGEFDQLHPHPGVAVLDLMGHPLVGRSVGVGTAIVARLQVGHPRDHDVERGVFVRLAHAVTVWGGSAITRAWRMHQPADLADRMLQAGRLGRRLGVAVDMHWLAVHFAILDLRADRKPLAAVRTDACVPGREASHQLAPVRIARSTARSMGGSQALQGLCG